MNKRKISVTLIYDKHYPGCLFIYEQNYPGSSKKFEECVMKKLLLIGLLVVCASSVFADPALNGASATSANTNTPNSQVNNATNSTDAAVTIAQQVGVVTDQQGLTTVHQSAVGGSQIQALRQSITDLRGLLENQSHQIQQLQVKQQMLEAALAQQGNTSIKSKTTPVTASTTPTTANQSTSATESDDLGVYESAFGSIKSKQYKQAIIGMQGYLRQYPKGKYAANAHYWLGELYSISGSSTKAISELNIVINNYSQSNKAADAMLKLGLMAYRSNQYQQAKTWFSKISKQYPNSGVARIAAQRLTQLKQAGY